MKVHVDFETRSKVDLRSAGVHRYAADPSTTVLSVAWAVEDRPVKAERVLGRPWPEELLELAAAKDTVFVAHNAMFERCVWAAQVDLPPVPIERWRCTMATCGYRGMPLGLDDAAAALGIQSRKLTYGRALLRLVSGRHDKSPRVSDPALVGEGGAPYHAELDADGFVVMSDRVWEALLAYNARDVEVERAVDEALGELPPAEQATWELDQRINDRGILVDRRLVDAMIRVREAAAEGLRSRLEWLTGYPAMSPSTLIEWLLAQGISVSSVAKPETDRLLADPRVPEYVKEVLTIHRQLSMTSVSKLSRLVAGLSADGRARGLFQYHGAATGRWAGRRVQPQNLPRPSNDHDIEALVEALATGDPDTVELTSGVSASQAVKDAMRHVFIASPGNVLCSVDFSSIEARVLAWLAGEDWKVDLFAAGGDPYIAAAERIFPAMRGKINKTSPERQKGKIAELALGYQGWIGAYKAMAGHNSPPDEEIEEICRAWRDAHPRVVALWRGLERAAYAAIADNRQTAYRSISYRPASYRGRRWLVCTLPNGKRLHYYDPRIQFSKRSAWQGEKREVLTYMGYRQTSSGGRQWQRIELYGGLLTENVVQAVSREILVEAMKRAEEAGYEIVLHVHDEITAEARIGSRLADHRVLEDVMRMPSPWRAGLPVDADGWTAQRYRK